MALERVLVAAPTSARHRHLLKNYLGQFFRFTFENKWLLLVEAGERDDDAYYRDLKDYTKNLENVTILKGPWFPSAMERLAHARNIISRFASNRNFTHILFLDTDTFIQPDSIERLLSHQKDLVGFICYIINHATKQTQICALKSGELLILKNEYGDYKTLDYEDTSSILHQSPNLIKVYAGAMSPLLVSRKVFEKTPFRYITSFGLGEDVTWHIENNDNGFEYWIDTKYIADHQQVGWEIVDKHAD